MSITIIDPPQTGDLFPNRRRWTREDCEFMERVGLLKNRYELIDGEIVEKVGQNQPHAITITLLIKWLIAVFGGDFVLCQLPVEVDAADRPSYRPEPDASVLNRPVTEFVTAPPGPADLRLVAEVSDTTLADDLRVKVGLYARAGFPEYWVLDVTSRRLIVHRAPQNGSYTAVRAYSAQETIAPEAAPDANVEISALLPPVAAEPV